MLRSFDWRSVWLYSIYVVRCGEMRFCPARHRSFTMSASPSVKLRGLDFEHRQLQDRDLGRIVHYSRVYRNAV